MRILKIIGIIVAALVGLYLLVPALLPSHVKMERSIVVAKPTPEVYAYVADYKNFNDWSPWHEMEPTEKTTLSTPSGGVGAKMSWEGKETGSGYMTITKMEQDKLINQDIEFTAPMQAKANVPILLSQADGGTKVTWVYEGDLGYMDRWFGLMLDGMLGKQYEKGLQNLKAKLEAMPATPAPTEEKKEAPKK